mmetsp:Transcript_44660/g.51397  ORF Transcript_44660/g.51397 Transcript_44660/m.51397 type:complete len:202 (-) Transcript_44660:341-946(-)
MEESKDIIKIHTSKEDANIVGIVNSFKEARRLVQEHRLWISGVGVCTTHQKQDQFLKEPFLLNELQLLALLDKTTAIELNLTPELKENLNLEKKSRKARIFLHLYNLGFYITSGSKFGCDFLVYEALPHVIHARYMVKVIENPQSLPLDQIVDLNRIATQARKDGLLAYISAEGDVKTTKIEWLRPTRLNYAEGNCDQDDY